MVHIDDMDTVDIDGMVEKDDLHIAVHNMEMEIVVVQHQENRHKVNPDDLQFLNVRLINYK